MFMIVASPCAMVLATMPPLLSTIANEVLDGPARDHTIDVLTFATGHRVDVALVVDPSGPLVCGGDQG